MKVKSRYTRPQKAARAAVVGTVVLGAVAIWGREPMARATGAAKSYSRIATALRQASNELELSGRQQTRIQAILREAVPQGVVLHDDMSLPPAQKRTKLRQLRTTTRSRIEQVLTAVQRGKARALLTSAQPRVHARMQQVAEELELSDTQNTEVRPILANAFKQGLAIKDDMSLTVAQKISRARQLKTDTRNELSSVLTTAQMVKLDKMVATAQADVAAFVRARKAGNIG